jgi:hypothetical protein
VGRLSVLVARNRTTFPNTPDTLLTEGLIDFGTSTSAGLEIVDDGSPTTHVLRDHTRLALAVTGDVLGTISVGQVFRLQADGVFSGTSYVSGGTVSANIEATATDNTSVTDVTVQTTSGPVTTPYLAAEYIRVGRGITGTITAVGDPANATTFLPCSINRVIVGPNDSPVGIQGNITADNGMIGVINTTGPIGAPASGSTPEHRPCDRLSRGRQRDRLPESRQADRLSRGRPDQLQRPEARPACARGPWQRFATPALADRRQLLRLDPRREHRLDRARFRMGPHPPQSELPLRHLDQGDHRRSDRRGLRRVKV